MNNDIKNCGIPIRTPQLFLYDIFHSFNGFQGVFMGIE